MNRRAFFRRAFPAAVAGTALAPRAVNAVLVHSLPDWIVVDGIEARWLGWRQLEAADLAWGGWLFVLPDGRMSYSTSGGVVSRDHRGGNCFDLRTLNNIWVTSLNDTPELRAQLRQAAFDRGIADARAWLTI